MLSVSQKKADFNNLKASSLKMFVFPTPLWCDAHETHVICFNILSKITQWTSINSRCCTAFEVMPMMTS